MALDRVLPRSWSATDGVARVGGVPLAALAERYDTPLYAVDEAHLEGRLTEYRAAFGPRATLVYAAKAFFCRAMGELLAALDWHVEVVSDGELEVALRSGILPERILMHGSAKRESEIDRAIAAGVGRVVVDHGREVAALEAGAERHEADVDLLLRLNLDVAAVTHPSVKTTGLPAQFGMDAETARRVTAEIEGHPRLRLTGVHVHVGSQITDLDTYRRAVVRVVEFLEPIRGRFADPVDVNLGGGLAVPYLRGDGAPAPATLAATIHAAFEEADAPGRLGEHGLMLEPGRSICANAGVSLYRVQARKRLSDDRDLLIVDGGMSDNPRPALYGARYELLQAERVDDLHDRPFRVVGRHCETGDLVSAEAWLPADTGPGDLLVVAATGAYAFSMSSRYNGVRRPPVIFLREGRASEVVCRETIDDLLAHDHGLARASRWRPGEAPS